MKARCTLGSEAERRKFISFMPRTECQRIFDFYEVFTLVDNKNVYKNRVETIKKRFLCINCAND